MAFICDIFTVNGLPKNNATAKLFSAGAFTSSPAKGASLPGSGSVLATSLTGPHNGCDGAYLFTDLVSGDYIVSITYAGTNSFHKHYLATPGGLGYTIRTEYITDQEALNVTPSGSTLFSPRFTRTVAGSGYDWIHPTAGTIRGLVSRQPINILGSGRDSYIKPAENDIELLTIYSPLGASEPNRYNTYEKFKILNDGGYTGCKGLVLDRAGRNRIRDVWVQGFDTGIDLKTAIITCIEDCFVLGCTVGIDTVNSYAGEGSSHALMIRGGEINQNDIGVAFTGISMGTIHGATVEGNSSGVVVHASNRVAALACYNENQTFGGDPAWDGVVRSFSRATWLDNMERVRIEQSNTVLLTRFRDLHTSELSVLQDTQGSREIYMLGTWWDGATSGNVTSQRSIIGLWEQGHLRANPVGRPWLNLVPAQDTYGSEIVRNPTLADSGNFYSLGNTAVSGLTNLFPGVRTVAYTTITTPNVSCTVQANLDISFTATTKAPFLNRTMTFSAWIQIPDTRWNAFFELVNGDSFPIGAGFKDGNPHLVTITMLCSGTATNVQPRLRFIATTGATGICFASGIQGVLGTVAPHAAMDEDIKPRIYNERRRYIKSAQSLDAGTQIDPFAGAIQKVQGNGAAVTGSTTTNLFSSSGQWQDGYRFELWGASDTNTYTLQSGGSSALFLVGAPTGNQRTLRKNSRIIFTYDSTQALWIGHAYEF